MVPLEHRPVQHIRYPRIVRLIQRQVDRMPDEYDPSAPATVAGILWQTRRALLHLLKSEKKSDKIRIEVEDDVSSINAAGVLVCAVQAKHHLVDAMLTAKSAEWWTTLRSWIKLDNEGKLSSVTRLVLCSTATLDAGSDLQLLTKEVRTSDDFEAIVTKLDNIATAKGNKDLRKAHDAWLKISHARKLALLGKTFLEPGQARLAETTGLLHQAVEERGHFSAERVPRATKLIVGWFENTLSDALSQSGAEITAAELSREIEATHQSLGPLVLQHIHQDAQHPDPTGELSKAPVYIQQLDILDAEDEDRLLAMNAVWAATKERDEWRQSTMTSLHELRSYDADLDQKWKSIQRAEIKRAQGSGATPQATGWSIFNECCKYHGRVGATPVQTHVVTGSYHMLADAIRVGWHPEFKKLILLKAQAESK